jgi:hypothetical protein
VFFTARSVVGCSFKHAYKSGSIEYIVSHMLSEEGNLVALPRNYKTGFAN